MGFLCVLDRSTGEFLLGSPFVKQTWAVGLDERGRPIPAKDRMPSAEGSLTYPEYKVERTGMRLPSARSLDCSI